MTTVNVADLKRACRIGLANMNLGEKLIDVIVDLQRQNKNKVVSNPDLKVGTGSAAEIRNDNAFDYMIDGKLYSAAAGETAFTATTHDLADGGTAMYLLSIDDEGTITITKGTEVTSGTPVVPATPAGEVAIGYLQLAADGAIFDATSDNLSAGHLTDTFVNLGLNDVDEVLDDD